MKCVITFLSIGLPALVCDCGKPAVRDLQRDDAFTIEVLRSARFAIGSIALARGDRGEFHRIEAEMENILRNRMVENIESIWVLPPEFVAKALSDSSSVFLRDRFESSGNVDDQCLSIIRQAAFDSVDYFVFVRIDEDAVYTSNSPISNDKGDNIGAYYMTTRRIGAYFQIIDIETGKRAWSGRISVKETAKNHYEEDKSSGILGSIIDDILFGSDEPGYPDPPSMQLVSDKLFNKFAEVLIVGK